MKRSILIAVVAVAVLLAGSLFLVQEPALRPVQVFSGGLDGSVQNGRELISGVDYQFSVEGVTENDGLMWFLGTDAGDDDILAQDNMAPHKTFDIPGAYFLRCLRNGELIGADSLVVVQGDRFVPLSKHMPSMADTIGTSIELIDRSENVEQRTWTVRRNGAVVSGPGTIRNGRGSQWTRATTGYAWTR